MLNDNVLGGGLFVSSASEIKSSLSVAGELFIDAGCSIAQHVHLDSSLSIGSFKRLGSSLFADARAAFASLLSLSVIGAAPFARAIELAYCA